MTTNTPLSSTQRYLFWLQNCTPARVRQWLGERAHAQALEQDFFRTMRFRTDPESILRYATLCPLPGVPTAAYSLRECHLPGAATVLAGIHFYAMDLTRPFVGVLAQSRDLSLDETLLASEILADQFAVFSPGAVQWWCACAQEDLRTLPGATGDQRLLIGHIEEIRQSTPPPSPLALTLSPDPDASSYARYTELYDAFLAAHPTWRDRLEKSDLDDYLTCAQAGGLFTLEIDGHTAGIIAARPGTLRGLPGWEMVDEILDQSYRGQGLAAPMQHAFFQQLDTQTHPLVLGTIDDANTPSLRTALRVGRHDAGGWVFVKTPT
ncbi:MAG: GNAT family N-acetyltransferase [Bradymonadaceae bacterium]|nr:GNAT family N-acetyltransferase [Lujinxingiaceae bacterium]